MTDDEFKSLLESMKRESALAHSETRRHFEVVADGTRKDIQLVAESVGVLSEKLVRTDETIERTAAETQAMIRLSHLEIDVGCARSRTPSPTFKRAWNVWKLRRSETRHPAVS